METKVAFISIKYAEARLGQLANMDLYVLSENVLIVGKLHLLAHEIKLNLCHKYYIYIKKMNLRVYIS